MNAATLRKALKRHLPQPIRSWLLSIKHRGARLPEAERYVSHFKGLRGIEVGGPSTIFSTQLPGRMVFARQEGRRQYETMSVLISLASK